MKRIRVGIAGCGEVTQIIHLPALNQLNDLYEVTALCDVSPTVLQGVGDLWSIERRYADFRDLVADPEVDAVLVANPDAYHAPTAMAALQNGKHVLVEKPMCLTLEEADALIAERDRTGLTVQVGYMRRYAPAFVEAVRKVSEMKAVRMARVHDVIGHNRLIIQNTSRVVRASDVPDAVKAEGGKLRAELIRTAIGDATPEEITTYGMLLGLASHDLSAMREILGMPHRVLYAAQRNGGKTVTVAFDYGGYVCHFEMSVDNLVRFDAHIEVYGDDQMIRVDWDTPYVRNLPIRLREWRSEGPGPGLEERNLHPGWDDPFVHEWQEFHRSVTEGMKTKAGPEDFRHDLELFLEIIRLVRAQAR